MSKSKSEKEQEKSEYREEERERESGRSDEPECPFCAAMAVLGRRKSRHPKFFGHLRQAETEVLKAFRSLIDDRLEECQEEKSPRKATKIKVS